MQPMPTEIFRLTVSQIRAEVYKAMLATPQQSSITAESSTPLLGTLFHQIAQRLTSTDAGGEIPLDTILVVQECSLGVWKESLVKAVYDRFFGPLIEQHQVSLASQTAELPALWLSIQELCGWLAQLRWFWTKEGTQSVTASEWIRAEQELSVTLPSSSGGKAVQLDGIADALVKREDGCWCVLEYKLGKASPEVDLLQGFLYHLMQKRHANFSESKQCGLAMVHFAPERRETLFATADMERAQQKLLSLIEAMVPRTASVSPVAPPKPVAAPAPTNQIEELKKQLTAAFRQFQLDVRFDQQPIVGPTFMRFPITLGRKVKVSQVLKLDTDIGVRLGLESIPTIHVDKGDVVIDIMRSDRQTVYLRDYIDQFPKPDRLQGSAKIPVGINLNSELEFVNLASPVSPHLLVAGTNGSGKSEWLVTALIGLMRQNTPETLRIVVIDPKRNGFLWLENSAFLEGEIIFPDDQDVCEVLTVWIDEMERRYRAFESDKDLTTYINRTGESCPRIVLVIDEFQNLLESSPDRKEIERLISRLGTKARAAGIHMILAMQQPSRKVLSGQIAANFPARVGLKTATAIESRVLLEQAGAENLLGNGDLYFRDIGDPRRLQALFIEQDERERLVASNQVELAT